MRRLERDGYVLPGGDGLTIDQTVPGVLFMDGRIGCAHGMSVGVKKTLKILSGEGPTAVVQTTKYTYHVMIDDRWNVFRYCAPHDDLAHPHHKPFHHKHIYDPLCGDLREVASHESETWPTLGEVIDEACQWYFDHAAEIELLRRH